MVFKLSADIRDQEPMRPSTRVKGIMRQGITIGNVTKHFKEQRSSTITFDQFLLQIDQTFTML